MLDTIGQIFWFGIFATPAIALFSVRKMDSSKSVKVIFGVLLTIVLAAMFAAIALGILFRHGLGPDSVY